MARATEKQRGDQAKISEALEAAGWKGSERHELFGAADYDYESSNGELHVEHKMRDDRVNLSFDAAGGKGAFRVRIAYKRKLAKLLELITSFQDDLSADNYKDHLNALVKEFPETDALQGDEASRLEAD
jgi:hypothetical protein